MTTGSGGAVIRIPIDVVAPIACSVTGADVPARLEQIEHLRRRIRTIDRTGTGLLLTFDADPELRTHLERFVLDEKGCCPFWGFRLDSTGTDLALRWDGPAAAQEVLDDLHRHLAGDGPVTEIAGLL